MSILQVALLAIIQGLAELLPVSSSAHVILAEKLMGLDPTSPEMTLLLVMLHTGTMFAVIVYFWQAWRDTYFRAGPGLIRNYLYVILATGVTGVIGLVLKRIIEHVAGGGDPSFELEHLFGNSKLIAAALTAAGLLIIVSSRLKGGDAPMSMQRAAIIGAVQGLCLPFRGFSRSGATISTGLALGIARRRAEEFSFALAVAVTPAVLVREVLRVVKAKDALIAAGHGAGFWPVFLPSVLGMFLAFLAGLAALRWLSQWLEEGRWHFFGAYCLFFAAVTAWVG